MILTVKQTHCFDKKGGCARSCWSVGRNRALVDRMCFLLAGLEAVADAD